MKMNRQLRKWPNYNYKKLIRDRNVKSQGLKYNFGKGQGCLYKNIGIRLFLKFLGLFFYWKWHGIGPRSHGPGPRWMVQESTDFIKQRSLVSRSMIRILYHEGVHNVLIMAVESKTDGQLLIKLNRYLGSNPGRRVLDGWQRATLGVLPPDGGGATLLVAAL
jgi:hypothetical protein